MSDKAPELNKYAYVIAHGDKDRGVLYWCGWDTNRKDHRFDRDVAQAVKFCTRDDAQRAGVGLTKGVVFVEVER